MPGRSFELRKYFILTFAFTWLVEGTALVLGRLFPGFPAGMMAPLGGLGPLVAAGSTAFWFYLLNLIPAAVVYGWLFHITRGSTLSAVLFHFMGSFIGKLFALPGPAALWLPALWLMPAALIAVLWKDGWQAAGDKPPEVEILAG